MKYEKGQSGNPNGRPKGSLNKKNEKRRENLTDFADDLFEKIKAELSELTLKEKIRLHRDVLPYTLSRLKPGSDESETPAEEVPEINMSIFTDDELRIIAALQAKAGIIET